MKVVGKDDCVILEKCIYGLVQAAMQHNKCVKILKKVSFTGVNVNQYCHVKKNEKDIVYIALYIDNSLLIGNLGFVCHVRKGLVTIK